jgi:hypothetical protein
VLDIGEEQRAALWRMQQQQLLNARLRMLRALAAPPGPYRKVRAAWRPIELAIAESQMSGPSPLEALEEPQDRRNPFGCLIP